VHPPRSAPRYSRRTSRRPRARWRSLLLWALLAGIVVVSIGTIYQFISVTREQRRFPPPGRLVDIGGRRLHVLCLGEGAPTVIMESSGLGTSVSAAAVREAVSRQTRVCSYDRAGLGWSDAGADEISAGDFADDLLRLLERGSIRPPYLLVPASVGGLTAEMFARRNPDRIAGMVWLDAADSGVLERVTARLRSTVISIETPVCLARVGANLGLLLILNPLDLDGGTDDCARTVALTYRAEPMATLCAQARGLPRSAREFAAAPPLRSDLPMTVLTASSLRGMLPPAFQSRIEGLAPQWRAAQEALSQRSSLATWRVVEGGDHLLASSKPDAVTAAILELLAVVRK
jgi:pimeloyl-ACP methyl ester carboxylesterase